MAASKEQLEVMKAKVMASVKSVDYLKEAVKYIDAAMAFARTPQATSDKATETFWAAVQGHLMMMADARNGNAEALAWLVENCPTEVKTFTGEGNYMQQARARLERVTKQQTKG